MTRTSRSDLPLCREVSNYSNLHPSGRFSNTSRRHSVFDKLQDFFPKHSYGKIATTVRTTWIPVRTRSSIRQVSHSKSRRPDASQHGSDARSLYMEITCSESSTVRTTRYHCLDVAQKQERISVNFSGNWLHSCPSGRPLTTVRTAPMFYQARRSFVTSIVFWIVDILGLAAPEWFFSYWVFHFVNKNSCVI
jgi:hypothetical protein